MLLGIGDLPLLFVTSGPAWTTSMYSYMDRLLYYFEVGYWSNATRPTYYISDIIFMITRVHHEWAGGGVFIVERWVQECATQIGRIFGQWPFFYLKIGLDIDRVFCKMLNFWWIFPLAYLWVVKKYLCIPIYMVKSTDLFKKRAFQHDQETNDSDIGYKFSSSLV